MFLISCTSYWGWTVKWLPFLFGFSWYTETISLPNCYQVVLIQIVFCKLVSGNVIYMVSDTFLQLYFCFFFQFGVLKLCWNLSCEDTSEMFFAVVSLNFTSVARAINGWNHSLPQSLGLLGQVTPGCSLTLDLSHSSCSCFSQLLYFMSGINPWQTSVKLAS